ncbi:alpha-amylase family glycosyl hydrolase [Flavimaricola marinus]|uniref:Oligo-1,6-glucosidase n=1 Tax=Flavimaricola marinus TaxID=1819565 RepID=A0A238LGY9_9RHOB|nr:alpha-amylase family glycosyl hydrolase [Flavimaricola marinus]SMY08842.1 Oligo-1,6-glucosidase [Flavimaricola marinus]
MTAIDNTAIRPDEAIDRDWWRGCVIYQIYPRSFQDSNGDGIGDLAGIVQRLPYIASLGVDAIWISPFFTSPMKDFGYDVSDYCDVDPMFGTLADFDTLVDTAHRLGVRVLIDLVVSHTSDQHPWFKESRSSRHNPKSDWYVWSNSKPDGTAPSNWLSVFGGPAWQWDTKREQYYMHNFLVEQPDLNFHNPDVQNAVLNVAKFWLEKGVDGFRLDTLNFYFHDDQLRSNPVMPEEFRTDICAPKVNPYNYQEHKYDRNRPEMFGFLQRFRALLDEYNATSVGEVGDGQRGLEIIGEYTSGNDKVHMCYAFDMLSSERPTAQRLAEIFERSESAVAGGWLCWAFSNHDCKRHTSRWNLSHQAQSLLTSFMMSARGSACIYQGEELALEEADVAFEDLQDPYGISFWPEFAGRDGCRTPMVWDGSNQHAGFSTAPRTWLPVSDAHRQKSPETMEKAQGAILHHYRRAIAFRHAHPALMKGDYQDIAVDGSVLSFIRVLNGQQVFCAFNLSDSAAEVTMPTGAWQTIGTELGGAVAAGGQTVGLDPWQPAFAARQTT